MDKIKRCAKCYKIISLEDTSDYYSHIRIKYCGECKAIVEREQAAVRMDRMRKRKKAEVKELKEKVHMLELENENLRARLTSALG